MSDMSVSIRKVERGDQPAIHALLEQAFENPEEADLVDALRADGDMALELVADLDGRIVGHVAFSVVEAPVWALALAPLSVAPGYQRRGFGKQLLTEGVKQVSAKGWEAVFVLGDPAYYERFGFSRKIAEVFNSPYEGDHFMALELKPGCLEKQHGNIRHASAFRKLP